MLSWLQSEARRMPEERVVKSSMEVVPGIVRRRIASLKSPIVGCCSTSEVLDAGTNWKRRSSVSPRDRKVSAFYCRRSNPVVRPTSGL